MRTYPRLEPVCRGWTDATDASVVCVRTRSASSAAAGQAVVRPRSRRSKPAAANQSVQTRRECRVFRIVQWIVNQRPLFIYVRAPIALHRGIARARVLGSQESAPSVKCKSEGSFRNHYLGPRREDDRRPGEGRRRRQAATGRRAANRLDLHEFLHGADDFRDFE